MADRPLPAVFDDRQVQGLMQAWLSEASRHRRRVVTLPPEYGRLRPFDVVAETSARNGFDAKAFRVLSVATDPLTLNVTLGLREVDPADYDWSATDLLPSPAAAIEVETPAALSVPGWNAAGIHVDPATGLVRIAGVQALDQRQSAAQIRVDGIAAALDLRATYSYVNQTISNALLDPGQIPIVGDLQLQISQALIALDGQAAQILLKADALTVSGLDTRLGAAEVDIDALQGEIALRVTTSAFDLLGDRVGVAEVQLSSMDAPTISLTVQETRRQAGAIDAGEIERLEDLLGAWLDRKAIREVSASAQLQLASSVSDRFVAEASARLAVQVDLAAFRANAATLYYSRAEADAAIATATTSLSATLTPQIAASAAASAAFALAGSSGGTYRFDDARQDPGLATRPPLVRLRPDQWVSVMPIGLRIAPALGFATSNQSEIDLVVMDLPANLPAPSGYGRVLFSGGSRVWDASRATAAIADGLLLPFADLAPAATWTATLAGDAVHAFGGYTEESFSTRRTDGLAARRLSPGVVRLEHRTIWPGAMASPTAVLEVGVSAITARVQ